MAERFVFFDLETTGLNSAEDQITEVAWITEDGEENSYFLRHTKLPNEWVLSSTDYITRILPAPKMLPAVVLNKLLMTCSKLSDGYFQNSEPPFVVARNEVFLVGACIAFDDRFLRKAYLDKVPYHYHVIDIEAMAMGKFNLPKPPRLKDLRSLLGIEGANEAPHTALADAREVKLIFDAMRGT